MNGELLMLLHFPCKKEDTYLILPSSPSGNESFKNLQMVKNQCSVPLKKFRIILMPSSLNQDTYKISNCKSSCGEFVMQENLQSCFL